MKEGSITKQKYIQPLTPAALYVRVSSDRQDVDLSVAAQLRALKEFARANGYSMTREYVDEAESARVDGLSRFREMIEATGQPTPDFHDLHVLRYSWIRWRDDAS